MAFNYQHEDVTRYFNETIVVNESRQGSPYPIDMDFMFMVKQKQGLG